MLAYGCEGNLLEHFTVQMLEHLQNHAEKVAVVKKIPLSLPPRDDQKGLEYHVRQILNLSPSTTLEEGLLGKTPRFRSGKTAILLLDFGVYLGSDVNTSMLEAWLRFCCEILPRECHQDVRLFAFLTLETPKDIKTRAEYLREKLILPTRAFHFEVLPPIGDVKIGDLSRYVTSNDCWCPEHLIGLMPQLIWRESKGRFSRTVDLINEAEQTSWEELYSRLLCKIDVEHEADAHKEDLTW